VRRDALDALERRVLARGGAEELRRRHRGTRLGGEERVARGWTDYRDGSSAAPIEAHAREVHYDVLRREGFSEERAREIAAESSELQARELERWRGERLVGPAGERAPAVRASGWDVRSILPASLLSDEDRRELEARRVAADGSSRVGK